MAATFKNRLFNPSFDVDTAGLLPVTKAAATDFTNYNFIDAWFLNGLKGSGSNGVAAVLSKVTVNPASFDLPGEAQHFLQAAVSNAGNQATGSRFEVSTRVPLDTLTDYYATFSAWLNNDVANRLFTVVVRRNYGTGGSPSPTDILYVERQRLDVGWRRYAVVFPVLPLNDPRFPKVLGTNNDGYIEFAFVFQAAAGALTTTSQPVVQPTTNTLQIAQPQFEQGTLVTDFVDQDTVTGRLNYNTQFGTAGGDVVGTAADLLVETLGGGATSALEFNDTVQLLKSDEFGVVDVSAAVVDGEAFTFDGWSLSATTGGNRLQIGFNGSGNIILGGYNSGYPVVIDNNGIGQTGISTFINGGLDDWLNNWGINATGLGEASFANNQFSIDTSGNLGCNDINAIYGQFSSVAAVDVSSPTYSSSGGLPVLNADSFQLVDGSGTLAIDLGSRVFADTFGANSVLSDNRQLIGTGGSAVLDWSGLSLVDAATVLSVDWNDRLLIDANGSPALNYSNRTLRASSGAQLVWVDDSNGGDLVGFAASTLDFGFQGGIAFGPGVPTATPTGSTGSLYIRSDGGTLTTIYRWNGAAWVGIL